MIVFQGENLKIKLKIKVFFLYLDLQGVSPPELLLYAFLPPLLLDAAMSLNWFIFKRVARHAIVFATLMVMVTVAVGAPFLLQVLNLSKRGWHWQHAVLFVSTLASTDALAVSAIVRHAGGPSDITALMESESLLNDASSLVLFDVFFSAVKALQTTTNGEGGTGVVELLPGIAKDVLRLSVGGTLVGLLLGFITLKGLKLLRRTGADISVELSSIQAMSFLAFYLAQGPLKVSGVLAVVSFGLYGAYTSQFELANGPMAQSVHAVQSTISTAFNSTIFFLAGATAANFLIRAQVSLKGELFLVFLAMPIIYLTMFTTRAAGVWLLDKSLVLFGMKSLSTKSLAFVTWGGLRGALSLIMAMVIATDLSRNQSEGQDDETNNLIIAQMLAWTSAFVLFTLCINAPTLPAALNICGLLKVPPAKERLRKRARKSLVRHTEQAIEDLRHDDDEMLRGVDWTLVKALSDPSDGTLRVLRSRRKSTKKIGMLKHASRKTILSSISAGEPIVSFVAVDDSDEGSVPSLSTSVDPDLEASLLSSSKTDSQGRKMSVHKKLVDEPFLLTRQGKAYGDLEGHSHISQSRSPPEQVSDSMRPVLSDLQKWWGLASPENTKEFLEEPMSGVKNSSPGEYEGMNDLEAIAEARARLIGGIKQFVYAKRKEGLLSPQGASILGLVFDSAVESLDKSVDLWDSIEAEVVGQASVQFAAAMFHGLRRSAYSFPAFFQRFLIPFTKLITSPFKNRLGLAMLRSIEVAIAYYMALTHATQVKWLEQEGGNSPLLLEIASEKKKVACFILDRETEASQLFQSIQTHRAIIAILSSQLNFVKEMSDAGVIDSIEHSQMYTPIESKLRALEVIGPAGKVWPRVEDVVSSLPYFSCLSSEQLQTLLTAGNLREVTSGETVWCSNDEKSDSPVAMVVIVRGLVLCGTEYDEEGNLESPEDIGKRFLGSGDTLGLLATVTQGRTALPGSSPAKVHSSRHAIVQGALLFTVPRYWVEEAKAFAEEEGDNNGRYQQMMLQMHRAAGDEILEIFSETVIESLAIMWRKILEKENRKKEGGSGEIVTERSEEDSPSYRSAKALWVRSQALAQRTLNEMRHNISKTTVSSLDPYVRYNEVSHVILLSGTIQQHSSSHLTGSSTGGMGERKLEAPAVIPYIAESISSQDYLLSGHEGALLLVWPEAIHSIAAAVKAVTDQKLLE